MGQSPTQMANDLAAVVNPREILFISWREEIAEGAAPLVTGIPDACSSVTALASSRKPSFLPE